MLEDVTVVSSWTNGAGVGVMSVVLQFGPFEPMKDVFPTRIFPCTVKFVAEEMAMP